jgi:hypothetical protein
LWFNIVDKRLYPVVLTSQVIFCTFPIVRRESMMQDRRVFKDLLVLLVTLLVISAAFVQACSSETPVESGQFYIDYMCPVDIEIEEGEEVYVGVGIIAMFKFPYEDEDFVNDFKARLEDGYAWTAESNDGGTVKLDGQSEGTDVPVQWTHTGTEMVHVDASDSDFERVTYNANVDVEGISSGNVVIAVKQLVSPPLLFIVPEGSDGPCIITIVEPTPDPPILGLIGNKSVTEGELLEFTISATDSDDAPLTFSVDNLPEGASFDSGTQTFSWTPYLGQEGEYPNIHFEVSDGELTDFEDITITVNPPDAYCWDVLWQIGDVEESQMDAPGDELNPSNPLGAQDFYVGVDSDDQFPAKSDWDDNIAPTINIHFTGGMPLGGRLLYSWSPGASAVERITVWLDDTVLGTLEREGTPNEDWWQSYERFVETFDIDELDDGEHTLTLEFTSGNGAEQDWVRLEEKVVCQ